MNSNKIEYLPFINDLIISNNNNNNNNNNNLNDYESQYIQYELMLEKMNEDLRILLLMKSKLFWNEIITNNSLLLFIDTYLYHMRKYIYNNTTLSQSHDDLCRRVLSVLLRIISYDEYRNILTIEQYKKALYDQWIFDIPKIIDICVIYGESNPEITKIIVNNIFEIEPNYYDDLYEGISLLFQALTEIIERFEKSDGTKLQTRSELRRVQEYLHDIIISLLSLATILPSSIEFYLDFKPIQLLCRCYELCVPILTRELGLVKVNTSLKQIRQDILKLAFIIIDGGYIKSSNDSSVNDLISIIQSLSDSSLRKNIHKVMLTVIYSPGVFLRRLNRHFNWLDKLIQSNKFEQVQIDYIKQAIQDVDDDNDGDKKKKKNTSNNTPEFLHLRDMFADMKEDLIIDCLQAYDNDATKVVHAILENNLPPHLAKRLNNQSNDKDNINMNMMEEKKVDDEMKFQQFLQETGRVSKDVAKKQQAENAPQLNNFDSIFDQDEMRAFLEQYEEQYEDEYDDTYDGLLPFSLGEDSNSFEMEAKIEMEMNTLNNNNNNADNSNNSINNNNNNNNNVNNDNNNSNQSDNKKYRPKNKNQKPYKKIDLSTRTKESLRARAKKNKSKGQYRKKQRAKKMTT